MLKRVLSSYEERRSWIVRKKSESLSRPDHLDARSNKIKIDEVFAHDIARFCWLYFKRGSFISLLLLFF